MTLLIIIKIYDTGYQLIRKDLWKMMSMSSIQKKVYEIVKHKATRATPCS